MFVIAAESSTASAGSVGGWALLREANAQMTNTVLINAPVALLQVDLPGMFQ
jgi:hypothetical protein